ncbi:hypothetical protein [Streptomyces sp. V1I6]|uniref:hypothetical protein n=1 Tax=Streptomyces sp. V1I6 TaxID=3042273 RepID=UPI00278020E8|nr:hypothetical protein [Streptomyces sp. V1I6]MDQ0847071.1 hypothetical protein [Streptomyces sp. V1I6]
MENRDSSFRRRLLIESLTVLAADAQTQAAWLDRYGVMTDEIALDFDHAFRMTEALAAEGHLAEGITADLQEIDMILSRMSDGDNADRWTRDALSTDEEGWGRARRLARRLLVAELGGWQQPLPEIKVVR